MFRTQLLMRRIEYAMEAEPASHLQAYANPRDVHLYERELEELLNELKVLMAKWELGMIAEYGPRTA